MLRSTGVVRSIDSLGRIVLPAETRTALGIGEQEEIEIFVDDNHAQIVLQKAGHRCMRCEGTDHLKEIKPGFHLCQECITKL